MRQLNLLFKMASYAVALLTAYALMDQWLTTLSRRITLWLRASRRRSVREVDRVVRTLLWSVMLTIVCPGALVALSIGPAQLVTANLSPVLLLAGGLVGLGEASLGAFLCHVAVQTAPTIAWGDGREELSRNAPSAVGKVASVLPFPFFLLAMLLYATAEETVLRGAFISASLPLGGAVALCGSVALSLIVQIFPRISWRQTLFSSIGTLVGAPVHGALFLAVRDVRPLITAQLVSILLTAA